MAQGIGKAGSWELGENNCYRRCRVKLVSPSLARVNLAALSCARAKVKRTGELNGALSVTLHIRALAGLDCNLALAFKGRPRALERAGRVGNNAAGKHARVTGK